MGEIQRQGIYNSIIAYLGILLGYLNMGILFPFILSTEQIGLYAVIAAIGQVGNTLVRFGTPSIAIRYLPFFKEHNADKGKFIGLQLLLIGVGAVVFLLLYLLLKPWLIVWYQDQSPLFVSYSHLVVPFTWCMLLFELLFGFARAYFLTVAAGFARDMLFRLMVLFLIIAFHFQLIDFTQFMWLYAFIYAIPSLFLLVYLVIKHDMPIDFKVGSLVQTKEMLVYGAFVSLGSLSTVLMNELDKIMLGGMSDLEAVGVYTVAAFFGAVIIAPARALLLIAAPLIAQFMKEGQITKIAAIYSKTSLNMVAVGLLIFIGLYINLHNIFRILPSEFSAGGYVIILIGLSKLFEMATGSNGDIIVNSRYFRYDLAFNVFLAILAVITNYIFIPLYGITGAALATAISILLYNILKTGFVYWKFHIQPFSVQTLYCIAIGAGVLVANYFLPRWDNLFVDIFIRSTLAVIIYLPLLFYFNISPDINGLVVKMLEEAKRRVGR